MSAARGALLRLGARMRLANAGAGFNRARGYGASTSARDEAIRAIVAFERRFAQHRPTDDDTFDSQRAEMGTV